MKSRYFLKAAWVFFLLTGSILMAHGQDINLRMIQFEGLTLVSSSAEIQELLGTPIKVYEPNYECGGLSAEWQAQPIFSLVYEDITFTGNKSWGYVIEEIRFGGNKEYVLTYGEFTLDENTKADKLLAIFGKEIQITPFENGISRVFIPDSACDEGLEIELKNGKLSKITYWTPC
ncbi:MAG: hypothetical protein AAF655_10230 [Bacteroidota bacterium]